MTADGTRGKGGLVLDVALILALVSIVIVACYRSGAFRNDFLASPDEPAHVVSALMIRAYLSQGPLAHPVTFAEQYYLHYPKVAIGHWPPLFHLLEALWMLLAGAGRWALVCFAAAVAAGLPVSVFVALRRSHGRVIAFVCAAWLAATDLLGGAAYAVAPDGLLALFGFWAALTHGRSLERGGRTYRPWLVLLIACALLTHGRGIALLLLPFWSAMIARRLTPWRAAAFAAALVVLGVVPIILGQGAPMLVTDVLNSARQFPRSVASAVGWPLCLMSLGGMAVALRRPRDEPIAVAMTALVASVWTLHAIVNVPFIESYSLTAAGAIAALAGFAWREGAALMPARFARATGIAWTVLVCAGLANEVAHPPYKPDSGYHRFVDAIRPADSRFAVSLVAANSSDEGAYVAEIALRDGTPNHVVLRGSKVLATSTWAGSSYHETFSNDADLSAFLDAAHVGVVIVERDSRQPHETALRRVLDSRHDIWREDAAATISSVRVFYRDGPAPAGPPRIRLDMRRTLGRYIELAP